MPARKASTASTEKKTKAPRKPKRRADHAREPVGADRHRAQDPAQGQGAQWRRGPAALAHLGDVPEVPRRPGGRARGRGRPRRQALPAHHRSTVPLARLGRPRGRHHRRRVARLHRAGHRGARRWQQGQGPVCLSARPGRPGREGQPARGGGQCLQGHPEPHGQRLPAARHRQQDQRHPLQRERRDAHAVAPVRVDAERDARRGGRLRRVLHTAPGGALHGAGDRPAPGRDRARPGLRHGRLSGRGL